MEIFSNSFNPGEPIPEQCAFGIPHPQDHVTFSDNRNPHLGWREVPGGASSLVLICVDIDVPTMAGDVNREDRQVSANLPRTEFCHWVMTDIPVNTPGIEEGACSEGVTHGGKTEPNGPDRSQQGLNDYTHWFASDKDMAGDYFGYDGPCPPWNDERIHNYQFILYALDIESCGLKGKFTLADVRDVMAGHVLAEATLSGQYTLNPNVILNP